MSSPKSRNDDGAPSRDRRIVYVVTSALTATHLLRGQLAHLAVHGFEPMVICAPGDGLSALAAEEGASVETISMRREISPLRDLAALTALWRALRRIRPKCVNASTPKAALLAMLAARALKVPIRIYTVRGLRLETARGLKRRLLETTERIALACATDVLCVSPSLAARIVELGLAPAGKLRVLASGSSNGVDYQRFAEAAAGSSRERLGLGPADKVVGFVGRLTRDKGIADLVAAFDILTESHPAARLLVIGDPEAGDPLAPEILARLENDPRIVLRGWASGIEEYYPLMDLLAFPSYREGFPNAPLEAACAGVPTVAYRVTGSSDAVVDEATGSLVERGDIEGLVGAIHAYLDNEALRRAHGERARERAFTSFRREIVWEAQLAEYSRLFAAASGEAATTGRDSH